MRAILDPLPVGRIWGVGRKTEQVLQRLGIRHIQELRGTPREKLAAAMGEHMAAHLLALADGQDDRPVAPREPAKSIGKEVTFLWICSLRQEPSKCCWNWLRKSAIVCAGKA